MNSIHHSGSRGTWLKLVGVLCVLGVLGWAVPADELRAQGLKREQLIPILGVTTGDDSHGTVVYLLLSFQDRDDHSGLIVHFRRSPGRFSRMAQTAIQQAILRAADSLDRSPDSWTVMLTVPYRDLTVYGESLSAMVSLSVVAMANGESIRDDLVLTGTVTPEGHIGPVGAVPQKILAAQAAHIRRVLIPDEHDPADSDWRTPFLMQVSPVRSVDEAYTALTEPLPVMAQR